MSSELQNPPDPPAGDEGSPAPAPAPEGHPELRPLPTPVRIALYFVGFLLVVVGLAGLVLPGIQGLATLVFAAAILSLASETVHRVLRSGLRAWPWGHRMLDRFRAKVHGWLSRE